MTHKKTTWLQGVFARWVERLLASELRSFGPWTESAAMTVIACGLGWWASPDDPLLLSGNFPWLLIAPLLIALRYGVLLGVFSILGLIVDWSIFARLAPEIQHFPRTWFAGSMLLTLICGEFNAIWNIRSERREESNTYLSERLTQLTRRYLLLRLSHDRIEQELLVKPGSLRDALLQLRRSREMTENQTILPGANELLQLMSQYCQLEAAAIYLPPEEDDEELGEAIAILGHPPSLRIDDPMLLEVLEQHTLTHVVEHMERSNHLAIAPILTANDTLLGLLVISHMPFFAVNQENMQFIALLLGYYADVIHGNKAVQHLQQQLPDCPHQFVEEVLRVQRVHERVGITSHVVTFRLKGEEGEHLVTEISRMRRGLDVLFPLKRNDDILLVTLLPLATTAASEGYIMRIQQWLSERHGKEFAELGIDIFDIDLARSDAVTQLANILTMEQARQHELAV
jgi:polysaccharide biosynthesis protein PelD